MSNEKKPKAPELPEANPSETKVKFIADCIFAGKKIKKGESLTVSKNVAKHLASRKLINSK